MSQITSPLLGVNVAPLDPAKETPDRLTTVVNIYHEHRGDQPFGVQVICSQILKEKEEPYTRRIRVGVMWKTVDTGWVESNKVGTITVENLEGKSPVTNPSKEELDEIDRKVLELSYTQNSDECELCSPGLISILRPAKAALLSIRCQHGEALCRITVFPR
jgi:hypothetical protein